MRNRCYVHPAPVFIRYRPRGGALVHWLFVRRDVERIFQYRQQRLKEMFGFPANKPVTGGAAGP